MKTDTLADWVHAWTYDKRQVYEFLGRINVSYRVFDEGRAWQDHQKLDLRRVMREAKRYRLDDAFMRMAAKKQIAQPGEMLAMTNLAQLPHDVMFVEYDDGVRSRAVAEAAAEIGATYGFDPDIDYGRAGLLFERFGDSANEWRITHFCDSDGSHPIWPYAAAFSLDRDIRTLTGAGEDFSTKEFIKQMMMSGWGYVDDNAGGTKLQYAIHDKLLQRGIATPEGRFFLPIIKGILREADNGRYDENMVSGLVTDAAEHYAKQSAGKLRWAVVILSSINVVPTLTIQHKAKGTFQHRLHNVPRLGFSTIHIDARPGHEVRTYEAAMAEATGRHNRWHEVRGHWRVVDTYGTHKPAMKFLCAHVVAERDGLYAMCSKCEHLIRWIDHHERGDERLGKVFHDYEVEG
jgi:hypothetical protein